MAYPATLLLRLLQPLLILWLPILVLGHGNHAAQAPLQDEPLSKDWATAHMQAEHHISNYDAASFFQLHDFDDDGFLESQEILRLYGAAEGSTDGMGSPGAHEPGQPGLRPTDDQLRKVVAQVLALFDGDHNGFITRAEWLTGNAEGKRLPDFGMGTGHHGDAEFEYEIHHFERYHDENTKEEDLTHPEDIAHFKLHDEHEEQEHRQQMMDKLNIVEKNIPYKFRVH